MLPLGVLKLQNTYILPLVDVSISFTPLLDFVLNACSKVDIHFVLFEFVVVLLWEARTFYRIMWAPHNGDHMGITLLKSFSYLKAEDDKFTGLEVQILVIASGSHYTKNEFFHRIDFFLCSVCRKTI